MPLSITPYLECRQRQRALVQDYGEALERAVAEGRMRASTAARCWENFLRQQEDRKRARG